jgi:peptidoglycan-N-acetylmuramic acid deacetylase
MADEGHLVCNHTKNHKDMTTLTEEEMVANLKFLEQLCLEQTGVEMAKYFRFPEGRYSKRTLLTAEKNGYKTIFWSLSHKDWDNAAQPNAEASMKLLCENTHNGAIILLHPTSSVNAEILPVLIDKWRAAGYSFGTLSDL